MYGRRAEETWGARAGRDNGMVSTLLAHDEFLTIQLLGPEHCIDESTDLAALWNALTTDLGRWRILESDTAQMHKYTAQAPRLREHARPDQELQALIAGPCQDRAGDSSDFTANTGLTQGELR